MNYKIIDNLSKENNHFVLIKQLFSKSKFVTIASPFLMPSFSSFFDEVNIGVLKKIHLITTMPRDSAEQFKKVPILISLFETIAKKGDIACEVFLNNNLHGKVYIFEMEDGSCHAVISSANFTDAGLSRNHEWGIEINHPETVFGIKKELLSTEDQPVLYDRLLSLREDIKNMPPNKKPQEDRKIGISLIDIMNPSYAIEDVENIWLKPYGSQDMKVDVSTLFAEDSPAHFSKRKPKGVKVNDILIVYGVGPTNILAIYKVTSTPLEVSLEEKEEDKNLKRWPWYVKVNNLTPKYGKNWMKYNFKLKSLQKEFTTLFPDENISFKGKTLGALNFGQDKVRLSRKFASFVINKIFAIEKATKQQE